MPLSVTIYARIGTFDQTLLDEEFCQKWCVRKFFVIGLKLSTEVDYNNFQVDIEKFRHLN